VGVEGVQNVQSYQPVEVTSNSGRSAPPQAEKPQEVQQVSVAESAKASSVIQFSKDAVSGRMLMRMVDPDSGEVVRQIPHEDIVAISRMLGLLFDRVA
jgi:flagellar protein FlaG